MRHEGNQNAQPTPRSAVQVSLPPPPCAPRSALAPHATPFCRCGSRVSLCASRAPPSPPRHPPALPPAAVCRWRWGGMPCLSRLGRGLLRARPCASRVNNALPTVSCARPVSLAACPPRACSNGPTANQRGTAVVTAVGTARPCMPCLSAPCGLLRARPARGVNSALPVPALEPLCARPVSLVVNSGLPTPRLFDRPLQTACSVTANPLPLVHTINCRWHTSNDQPPLVSCALAFPPKSPRALLPQATNTHTHPTHTHTHTHTHALSLSLPLCLTPAHPFPLLRLLLALVHQLFFIPARATPLTHAHTLSHTHTRTLSLSVYVPLRVCRSCAPPVICPVCLRMGLGLLRARPSPLVALTAPCPLSPLGATPRTPCLSSLTAL